MCRVRSPYAWWTPVTLLKYRLIILSITPVTGYRFLPFSYSDPISSPLAIRTTGLTDTAGNIIKLASIEKPFVWLCSLLNASIPRVSSTKIKGVNATSYKVSLRAFRETKKTWWRKQSVSRNFCNGGYVKKR